MIRDGGNDGRDAGDDRHACLRQLTDSLHPPEGMSRARFESARDLWVKGRYGDHYGNELVARHLLQKIKVAKNPVGLCRDEEWVAAFS
ncbi:hypothetical protein TomTYG45_18220 [Sphingobium sp. TomTYG45]